tara:strand:+ start:2089 stop:2481 length:393 start_codon:yes stop_codon:yes gene_type:complete
MIEDTIKANTEALRDMIDILCKIKISQDQILLDDPRQAKFNFNSSAKEEETKPEEPQKPIPHPTSELLNDEQKTFIRQKVIFLKGKNVDTTEFADLMSDLGYKGLSSVPQGHYQKLIEWVESKEQVVGVA